MRVKTGLGLLLAAAVAHAMARPSKAEQLRRRHSDRSLAEPLALAPVSSPAVATGALALGALAVGALAIGALAIGRLEIKRARFRKLEVDDLTVRRLHVADEDEPENLEQDDEMES